jgi:serine/threonine protein phosphatase PrpC
VETKLKIVAATYTHAGRRRSNQDAVVATKLVRNQFLVAVADGMGGHSAGEVASARALEVLISEMQRGSGLHDAFAAANRVVHAEGAENPVWKGMGTTLVVLFCAGNRYHIANVGDSRAYRVDARSVVQLTADHSFTAEAVREGAMSLEEAATSPWRNALTRAIGTDREVEVDVFGPFSADEAHAVLLCSDGLYKSLEERVFRDYILATENAGAAAESLATLAYRRGSDDNITAAVIEFGALHRQLPDVTLPIPIAHPGAARSK